MNIKNILSEYQTVQVRHRELQKELFSYWKDYHLDRMWDDFKDRNSFLLWGEDGAPSTETGPHQHDVLEEFIVNEDDVYISTSNIRDSDPSGRYFPRKALESPEAFESYLVQFESELKGQKSRKSSDCSDDYQTYLRLKNKYEKSS